MPLNYAHDFHVETLNATENNYGGISGLIELKNAACIAAGHRSAERLDPPKCHPETRQAVISNIMSWVNSKDPGEPIMWLNGPAGAGKSAIAQTVAERCHKEKKLISSFFFSRTFTSGGRDEGARLIPTISYHLTIAVPETKKVIMSVFDDNPAILSYSMEDQMKDLVLGPLAKVIGRIDVAGIPTPPTPHRLIIDGFDEYNQPVVARTDATGVSASPIPHLVIIDGLDECNNPDIQSMILNVIAGVRAAEPSIHLRFLIASRPERAIRKTFKSLGNIYVGLTLDESYNPDRDIEVYLCSEFARIKRTHTLAHDLAVNSGWPSQRDIESLVEKSSGQFIYASTIVKFVDNDRKDPRDRLRTILNVSPGERSDGSPFAPLDALYTFILSTAVAEAEGYDSILRIFQVLLYSANVTVDRSRQIRIDSDKRIAEFFSVSRTVVRLSLVDLHSIMFIPGSSDSSSETIRFFHASFGDFLKDSSRSSVFFVEDIKAHIALGNRSLDIVLEQKAKDNNGNMSNVLYYARCYYFMHMERSGFHEDILVKLRGHDIRSVIPEIFSRLYVEDIDSILDIFCERHGHVNNTIWCNWRDVVPLSKMHGDIINYISPGIDKFFLTRYPSHDMFNNILFLYGWSGRRSNNLYKCWLGTLMESPARGKRLFMSEEKCEHLVRHIFQEWKMKKAAYPYSIRNDMIALTELPNLVASLREFELSEYDMSVSRHSSTCGSRNSVYKGIWSPLQARPSRPTIQNQICRKKNSSPVDEDS